MYYPEILLPRQSYPILENIDIIENALARETKMDVYQFLAKPNNNIDDILPLVVAPQPSLREVFELSLFLYGYYDEQHSGLRVDDNNLYTDWNNEKSDLKSEEIKYFREKSYLLFLSASKLNQQEIDYNGETHILSFSHKPTCANYWHFELWVKDSIGNRIPRDKSNTHTKYLAKSILEYIISEALIFKVSVIPFKHPDFEKI